MTLTDEATMTAVNQLIEAGLGVLKSRQIVFSGSPAEFKLIKPQVKVLEMEDVLFHFSSAVVMPSAPEGSSAADGADNTDSDEAKRRRLQKRVTGLHVMALTYKVLEEHHTLGLLIAGHTDTTGSIESNYTLSEQRANNVLFLLEQRRDEWAQLCLKRHRIEDYQQIMKHYSKKHADWQCDPGAINNSYNDPTHTATQGFFRSNGIDEALADDVKHDHDHKWPLAAWLAVYDLYDLEIDQILGEVNRNQQPKQGPDKVNTCSTGGPHSVGPQPRSTRLRFADIARKILPCGESFPIQKRLRDNYRSQENRRVELLFFNAGDLPPFTLPDNKDQILTPEMAPIFHPDFFEHIYVDPTDIFAVKYHLRFVYYNRFTKQVESVPKGLVISAIDDSLKPVEKDVEFEDGVYIVKVPDDDARQTIHFEFKTTDSWIFMDTSGGKLQTKKRDEVKSLSLHERFHFYDLPEIWSSHNYWTRHDNSMDVADRYEIVMRNRKQIKPFGNNRTESKAPLTFSLDDVVLVDRTGSQNVSDKNEANQPLTLANASRFALLHVVDNKLTLFDPDPADRNFTLQRLSTNLITKLPEEPRLVIFANDFYDIWDKRAAQASAPFRSFRDVRGCRAASLNDRECRFGERVVNRETGVPTKPYFAQDAGNFELHLIRNGCILEGSQPVPRSFLLVYWNARMHAHFDPKNDLKDKKEVTAAELKTYADSGFFNARFRWEQKEYTIDPLADDTGAPLEIWPAFYFEPKFAGRGGSHKCMIDVSNNPDVAFMGIDHSQMYRTDHSTRADTGGEEVDDLDLSTSNNLVIGHEIGHALGRPDEYIYNFDKDQAFDQHLPGAPFASDRLGLMCNSMAFQRMRYFWPWVNWLNDSSKVDGKLKEFLQGRQFRVRYFYKFLDGEMFRIRELSHFLVDEYRHIYKPFRSDSKHAIATGKIELDLYKIGEDERAWTFRVGESRARFPFDAILAIYSKIGVHFINNPKKASDRWTDQMQKDWRIDLANEFRGINGGSFLGLPKAAIRSGADGERDRAFRNVVPGFRVQVLKDPPPGKAHFTITVVLRHDAKISKHANGSLEVGNDTSKVWIVNYLLGKDDGATEATTALNPTDKRLKTEDLTFLRDWVRQQLGNNSYEYSKEIEAQTFV